ncbi:MFS transporter, phthalate permease protein, partial [Pseudomonas syringae pv. actinidiae]
MSGFVVGLHDPYRWQMSSPRRCQGACNATPKKQLYPRKKIISGSSTMQKSKPTHVRYLILLMLFLVTTINYADRATIAIAGSSIQKDLGISAVTLGYIFSAFGWAYVAGQIPGGWLLDRFGSKKVYAMSIFTWSLFTLLQGYVGEFGISTAIVALFMLRFLVGLAEAPSFPGNARIVAAWFPTAERGTA